METRIVLEQKYRDMLVRASSGSKTGKEYDALTDEQQEEAIKQIELVVEGLKRKQPEAFINFNKGKDDGTQDSE